MIIKKIGKETEHVRNKVREVTAAYIASGLGIVVGLSWNEAIKSGIEYLYPASSGGSIFAKFIYAFILTVIVVFVTVYIVRPPEKEKSQEKK
jgi:uncharacterized BrkB/YihY/UPF0761 family membrane protein